MCVCVCVTSGVHLTPCDCADDARIWVASSPIVCRCCVCLNVLHCMYVCVCVVAPRRAGSNSLMDLCSLGFVGTAVAVDVVRRPTPSTRHANETRQKKQTTTNPEWCENSVLLLGLCPGHSTERTHKVNYIMNGAGVRNYYCTEVCVGGRTYFSYTLAALIPRGFCAVSCPWCRGALVFVCRAPIALA